MQTQWSRESASRPGELDAVSTFRRILVPIDFDDGSRRALAMALELPRSTAVSKGSSRCPRQPRSTMLLVGRKEETSLLP